jgi:hypothetical protein
MYEFFSRAIRAWRAIGQSISDDFPDAHVLAVDDSIGLHIIQNDIPVDARSYEPEAQLLGLHATS